MGEPNSRDRAIERIQSHRAQRRDPATLFALLQEGSREALAEAITDVERNLPESRERADALLSRCLQSQTTSRRIGITGVPGVGKSTFIETFGLKLIDEGHRVAVLAIDPSSSRTGGSILGDKTRMEQLSRNEHAFIRPSAAADTLGGVARATRETIMLCEAAGFDIIIVETVGVGQSETSVHGMVDFFLLLMLAGAGDELQGIKRGIMEMADAIVITKADGNNINAAQNAARQYTGALHLFPPAENQWTPIVRTSSALKNEGIDAIIGLITDFFSLISASGWMVEHRRRQDLLWLDEAIRNEVFETVGRHAGMRKQLDNLREQVSARQISPFSAARLMVSALLGGSFS